MEESNESETIDGDPLNTENAIACMPSTTEQYFLKLSKSVFIVFIAFSSFFKAVCIRESFIVLQVLDFFCFFYFTFVIYIIFFSFIFLFLYQLFNLFNCFQRHLLVILSNLVVAAMSLVMKLRQTLIQLPIQVYKYNFSAKTTLYIKHLTINTSFPDEGQKFTFPVV